MTDTPPPDSNNPAAHAWPPITAKALSRLRTLVQGNGIQPDAVQVIKTDEQSYEITADLLLQASWDLKPLSARQAQGEQLIKLQQQSDVEALRSAALPNGWVEEARRDLDPLPGHGWGLNDKVLTLPQYRSIYALDLKCTHCRGQTRSLCTTCHGRGHVTCPTCHGAGHLPHAAGQNCPTCNGRNQVQCLLCKGTGHEPCTHCKGSGNSTTYFMRQLFVTTSFRQTGSGIDLPTPLRRSIDRAGLDKLAKGHATITRDDDAGDPAHRIDRIVPPTHMFHYRAMLPFAEVVFEIDGKRQKACLLGQKPAILELGCVLDEILEQHTKAGKLSALRIYNDARQMAAEGKPFDSFHRCYVLGVSQPMLRRLWKTAGREIYSATHRQRWLSLALGTLLGCFMIYGWFDYNWRLPLLRHLHTPKLVDILLPAILFGVISLIAGLVQRYQITKLYGVRGARLRFAQWDVLPVIIVLYGFFTLYVLYGADPPDWYTGSKLAAQIEERSRNVDPPVE